MPLNQTLFDLLHQQFGDVAIANEGEALVTGTTCDVSGQQRLTQIDSSGEYYRVCCPFCGDTRKRLWINHRFGTIDPFTGRRMLFLAHCYNERCLHRRGNVRKLDDMIFGLRNVNERSQMVIRPGRVNPTPPGPVPPPGDLVPISQLPAYHPAVQYLVVERQFTIDTLSGFGVCLCVRAAPGNKLAEGRIIIPIYRDANVVGWQARFVGKPPDEDIPPYYSCRGMRKSQLLYNLDASKDRRFVVIVEGVTDVWRVGSPAVAPLGKTLSDAQFRLVEHHWANKPVVVMLDPDAREEMHGVVNDLLRVHRAPVLSVTLPPGTDPASHTTEEVWSLIDQHARAQGLVLNWSESVPDTAVASTVAADRPTDTTDPRSCAARASSIDPDTEPDAHRDVRNAPVIWEEEVI